MGVRSTRASAPCGSVPKSGARSGARRTSRRRWPGSSRPTNWPTWCVLHGRTSGGEAGTPRDPRAARSARPIDPILGDLKEVLSSRTRFGRTLGHLDKASAIFLREQLRSIRKELGEEGDVESELDDLRRRVAELPLDDAARELVERDLQRLSRTPEQSAEHPMLRTWVETLLELPWALPERAALNLRQAEAVLEEDHYGLERVKTRILEALAVRKRAPAGQGTILCLVGPRRGQDIPGAQRRSSAGATLRARGPWWGSRRGGGPRPSTDLRGRDAGAHPQGAAGGRRSGSRLRARRGGQVGPWDPRGSIGCARGPRSRAERELHRCVPRDFDLSRVFFPATANVLHEIPGPLRDRMEVLEAVAHGGGETQIAKQHLWPEQRRRRAWAARGALRASGLASSRIRARGWSPGACTQA